MLDGSTDREIFAGLFLEVGFKSGPYHGIKLSTLRPRGDRSRNAELVFTPSICEP